MSAWRVIITDSESMTGVAPVCEEPGHPGRASIAGLEGAATTGGSPWVFDCYPYPQIELCSERGAAHMAALLSEYDAEICS